MADQKIRWKRPASGSLARRVIFICFLLLVFPLLIHTYFLYSQEHLEKAEEILQTFQMIGEGEKSFLEEKISFYQDLLKTVAEKIPRQASLFGIQEVFLPENRSGSFNYIDSRGLFLVLGREIPHQRALVMTFSLQEIFQELAKVEKGPFFLSFAIEQDGNIVYGNESFHPFVKKFPIKDAGFSLVLSVPLEQLKELNQSKVLKSSFVFLGLIIFLGGFLVWAFTKRIAKPFKTLIYAMHEVEMGKEEIRYKKDLFGFEINQIGLQWNQTLDALFEHKNLVEEEKLRREKLAQELRIGHQIQKDLFPKKSLKGHGVEIFSHFSPSKEVSGDFYDFFPLEDGSLFFCIADTAGKGLPACLYSLGLRSSLRSFASLGLPLSEIVLRASDFLWEDAKTQGMFTTLWVGIYHKKTKKLTFLSQGHPPAFLISRGKLEKLSTDGIAMGAQKFEALHPKEIMIFSGDHLFLYTDGLIEELDTKLEPFGLKRVQNYLLDAPCRKEKLLEGLVGALREFSGKKETQDDITLLSLEFQ